jgi:integrase
MFAPVEAVHPLLKPLCRLVAAERAPGNTCSTTRDGVGTGCGRGGGGTSSFGAVFTSFARAASKRRSLSACRFLELDFSINVILSSRTGDSVSIPAFVVEALRKQHRAQSERRLAAAVAWSDHDLVLDDGIGGPLRTVNVSGQFADLVRRAALHGRLHDLRHAWVSQLLARGVPIITVSRMAGHSTAAFTIDRYGHLMSGAGEVAAAAIQEALGDVISAGTVDRR